MLNDANRGALQETIRTLYGCESKWLEAVSLKVMGPTVLEVMGQSIWDGVIQVFELAGHPTATRCYAWFPAPETEPGRCVAFLHEGWIDSPEKAVRVAITAERDERLIQLEMVEFNIEQLETMEPGAAGYEQTIDALKEDRIRLRRELGLE